MCWNAKPSASLMTTMRATKREKGEEHGQATTGMCPKCRCVILREAQRPGRYAVTLPKLCFLARIARSNALKIVSLIAPNSPFSCKAL